MWQRLPKKGGFTETPGDTAWPEMSPAIMESTYNTMRTDSFGFPTGPEPCLQHKPWHYLSDQELGDERGQGHGTGSSTCMTESGNQRLRFLSFPLSFSEITQENKPLDMKPDSPKTDKLPNICKQESISPMAKVKTLIFSIA